MFTSFGINTFTFLGVTALSEMIFLSCCGVACRWPLSSAVAADPGYKIPGRKGSSLQPPMELLKVFEADRAKGKEVFQRYEWLGRFMRFRNDAIIIFSIICLQLPFELAYAHLYEVIGSDVIK
jgi:anoctamin-10